MSNYRLPTNTVAGRRQRRNRINYRLSRITSRAPFFAVAIFAVALIAFHVITLATGVAHYEFHGIFAGFDYSIDLGGFHYHYGKGFGRYERTYDFG